MKLKNLIIFLLVMGSGLFFASCSSDDGLGDNSPVAIKFGAGNIARTKTMVGGDQWMLNDRIGIFGQTLNSANIAEGAENIQYKAQTESTNVSGFTPTGETIYYPQDGSKVDFVAYYPYKTHFSTYLYPINTSDQSYPVAIDVLYSNNATNKDRNGGQIDMQFEHLLNKASVTLTSGIGVVFWLDPLSSGTNGKIVSLDEGNTDRGGGVYGVRWDQNDAGTEAGNFTTNATNTADGCANMATIKNYISTNAKQWLNFPAFAWVDLKNGTQGMTTYAAGAKGFWYLPAIDDLSDLFLVWDGDRGTFNAKLTAATGGATITNDVYLSSMEGANTIVMGFNFYGGVPNSNVKDDHLRARAVLAF